VARGLAPVALRSGAKTCDWWLSGTPQFPVLRLLRSRTGASPLATKTTKAFSCRYSFTGIRVFTQHKQSCPGQPGTSLECAIENLKGSNGMPTQPNSHRLRLGRYSESGRAYLITAVVHDRQPVFSDWHLGRLLVAELRRAHESIAVSSFAWVVMPDHFHWLMQLEEGNLGHVIGAIKSRCTRTLNEVTGRHGPLWQTGYHDRAIRDGEDLLPFARYIVANPLRAGLVDKIGDYPLWDAC
jgi:REP element-mobilizing transposase RayT